MDKELRHKNLVVTILALASDKQSQIDYTVPGCTICDLTEDFDNYGQKCFDKTHYSAEQCKVIDDLNLLIDKLVELDFECFDTSVLDNPIWIEIRNKALEALKRFGYSLIPLPKNIEYRSGSWRVDISNYDLKKI
jgi:hypothetical protein